MVFQARMRGFTVAGLREGLVLAVEGCNERMAIGGEGCVSLVRSCKQVKELTAT